MFNTCTLIDNIFTNNYSISSNFFSGILKADITDHYILFHIIKDKDGKKDDSNEYKTVRIVNESRTNQFIEKIKMLTGLYWIHIETVKHISQNSTHCSKLYMMDHFHSLELKCDTEIASPGSQMD